MEDNHMNIKKILSVGMVLVFIFGIYACGALPVSADDASSTTATSSPAPSSTSVTGVSLNETSAALTVGNTDQLAPTTAPSDATNQAVSYLSSDPTIASVDGNGLITAVAAGSATVTVTTADGGFTATDALTVASAAVATTTPTSTPATSSTSAANLVLALPTSTTITQSPGLVSEAADGSAASSSVATAINGISPIIMTVANNGNATSTNVLINPIDANSNLQLWAQDATGAWYDVNIAGWGSNQGQGFLLSASDSTTIDVYPISDIPGSYSFAADVVDVHSSSTVLATANDSVTVAAVATSTASSSAIDTSTVATTTPTLLTPTSTEPTSTPDTATSIAITIPATSITDTSALLNGTINGAGADYTSFWLGTTPISDPLSGGSPVIPAGWSHIDFPGVKSLGALLSGSLTDLTPNTQYYFIAWARVDGIWFPGAIQTFTTL